MLAFVIIVAGVWTLVALIVGLALGRAAHIGQEMHDREILNGWMIERLEPVHD